MCITNLSHLYTYIYPQGISPGGIRPSVGPRGQKGETGYSGGPGIVFGKFDFFALMLNQFGNYPCQEVTFSLRFVCLFVCFLFVCLRAR